MSDENDEILPVETDETEESIPVYDPYADAFEAALSALPNYSDMQGFELALHIADNSQALENTLAALTEICAMLRTGVPNEPLALKALWSDLFELSTALSSIWLLTATGKLALFELRQAPTRR